MPRRRTIWLLAGLVIGIGAGGGMGSLAAMFSSLPSFENTPSPAVDLMRRYGCAGCHQVPGIPSARGTVGPSLEGIADRRFLGGVVPNTLDALITWIVDPRRMAPHTAMPVTGITEQEARMVVEYLLKS
jgi:cytochrome c2